MALADVGAGCELLVRDEGTEPKTVLPHVDPVQRRNPMDRDDALRQPRLPGAGTDDEVGTAGDGPCTACESAHRLLDTRRRDEGAHAPSPASHTRSGVIGNACTR